MPAVPHCARVRPFPGPPLSAYPIRLCSTPPRGNPLCYTPSPSFSLGDANLAGRAHFLSLKSSLSLLRRPLSAPIPSPVSEAPPCSCSLPFLERLHSNPPSSQKSPFLLQPPSPSSGLSSSVPSLILLPQPLPPLHIPSVQNLACFPSISYLLPLPPFLLYLPPLPFRVPHPGCIRPPSKSRLLPPSSFIVSILI